MVEQSAGKYKMYLDVREVKGMTEKDSHAKINKLLCKKIKWEWTEAQENVFNKIKVPLTTIPILACPDFRNSFILKTDASGTGLESQNYVIVFAVQELTETEKIFEYRKRMFKCNLGY